VAPISEMVGLTACSSSSLQVQLGPQAETTGGPGPRSQSHQRSEPESPQASDATLRLGVEVPGKASGGQARRVRSLGTVMCVFTLTLLVAISELNVLPELTRVLRLCQWPGAQLKASGALAGPQADRQCQLEYRGGHGVHAAISPGERQALVNFYVATNGPSWTASKVTGWPDYANHSVDPCTAIWTGVSCNAGGTSVVYVPRSFSLT
jgi:hypothetical protein